MARNLSIIGIVVFALASPTWGQSFDLKVMSFNVWSADSQTAKLAEIIQAGDADIVGLQEMNAGSGQALANQLGWYYHQQSNSDIQVLSKFAIVGQSTDNRGVQIEVTPGHNAWLYNSHLAPYPYQPYDLRDTPGLTEAQLIAGANNSRGGQIDAYLNSIASTTSSSDHVFFTGDFNEPSHLDWTQAAANASPRSFDKKVVYPTSEKIVNAGFSDSFRAVHPDEVAKTGYTWTPGYPPPNLNSDEVHDRIDFVYSRGPNLTTSSSQTIGLTTANPNTDIAVAGYNADHRAVVSGFSLSGLQGSTLTFSRLDHNPGDDSALNGGDYGDRLATSGNVEVEFSATGTSHWDTYDGGRDNNGDNNWNVGVAQLQFGSGSAEYDVAFMPDEGFGVIVDSFDLLDYTGGGGHTVNWELWSGDADVGTLLTSNGEIPVTISAGGTRSLLSNYNTAIYGTLTLRIEHLTGAGDSLAIDNIGFRQVVSVPEPGSLGVLLSFSAIGMLRRRRS